MYVIRLLRNRWELRGSLYFEFQAGPFADEHWRPGSVYIREEFWPDLGAIVRRREPKYGEWGHWSFTTIDAAVWAGILADFEALAVGLKAADRDAVAVLLPWMFGWYDPLQSPAWRTVALRYAMLVRDLSTWTRRQLETHDCVSILGI